MKISIINHLTINGKSTVSEKILLKGLKLMYKSFTKNHKKIIKRALINLTPLLKVKQLKQKKRRSHVKEFPYIVQSKNRVALALKFLINKTSNKNKLNTHKTLFTELLTVVNNSGTIVSKKKSLYEYAFIKKKYFYYRWF